MFMNLFICICCFLLAATLPSYSQPADLGKDTFFLSKKKGLLGRLGRELDRQPWVQVLNEGNPFLRFKGKIIRSIEIVPMGLHESLMDEYGKEQSFSSRLADAFHRDTRKSVIKKNLFFQEGQKLLPLLFADNAKFLREQPFFKDAVIIVLNALNSQDSVDVTVVAWDVFSIGGNARAGNDYTAIEVREENLAGTGDQLMVKGLYDMARRPSYGFGAGWISRNIKSRFFNFSTGFSSFNNSYTNGDREESVMYASLNKPLVSRYTQWTGALSGEYHFSQNAYHGDSLYRSDYDYEFGKLDGWAGYNFGWNHDRLNDNEDRIRHFLAGRFYISQFNARPGKYESVYNYRFADDIGILFSHALYRQNYRRTNFVYGFGISEDVPSGMNASLTAGWTKKQQQERMYLGMEANWDHYRKSGSYFSPGLRIAGYSAGGRWEDLDFLVNADYFSKLWILNPNWLLRHFLSASYARQFNTKLNGPLFLSSDFGLRSYGVDTLNGSARATVRYESVFINLRKFLGFRFAPFVFADMSALTDNSGFTSTYPALGTGVRTRNENLVFGTIELRGYFFPNPPDGLRGWKLELRSNLRFRFSSNFVNKADVLSFN